MNKKKIVIIVSIVCGVIVLLNALVFLGAVFFLGFDIAFSKPEEVRDISKYNEVIGKDSKGNFESKWGVNEELFPSKIKDSYDVVDFVSVYYNPWDAQYLSLLVIDYNEEDYLEEVKRLNNYGIENYKGIYGATGFNNYRLLAMESDSYYGFIYALTDDDHRIIYVEMIFCNYFMDLDYKNYIKEEYLPVGFDATMDNPYEKEQMRRK